MNAKILLTHLFKEILNEIESLSSSDQKKLESGDFSISLKVIKKSSLSKRSKELSEEEAQQILEQLKNCKNRELGHEILLSNFKNRKELEHFAKLIDVYVMKQDKIDRIREKIIEGTIGASLRSTVIQGKET